MTQHPPVTPAYVKQQLDEILAREIISFIDVDVDAAMMSFNLATIACISLIVEREKEIKQYADFPPERYLQDSFYSELTDIGLTHDDYLDAAVTACFKKGYMREDDNGQLHAEMPAFMMAGLLDSMFPGMQGMNLIAFVLQMNDEVNTGRKSLDLAKKSFAASLKSSGVSVSGDNATKRASAMKSGKIKAVQENKDISRKLKKENLDRLSRLVKTRRKTSDAYQQKIQVTDVFDKGPTPEEIAARKEEVRKAEAAAKKAADLARQLAEKDEKIKEAQMLAQEAAEQRKILEEKEQQLQDARQMAAKAEERAAELEAKEAAMAEREASLKAMEERIRAEEEQIRKRKESEAVPESQPPAPGENISEDAEEDDIAAKIAAFESDLAMSCPVCGSGKIVSSTTEKGKAYFSCSSRDCRFVSWDKPYHFICPLCKNPFLTETTTPEGEKGLKCPRASCAYSQPNLNDPKLNTAASGDTAAEPRKKRKVVRRKKRR
ncbi:MAG: DNA topoisomerase I [Desulfotignum sp.]|jgi:chemotaxis protein histidine kinase CheA|nr:DNA topoisomerase I [Desulfotignum sp.]